METCVESGGRGTRRADQIEVKRHAVAAHQAEGRRLAEEQDRVEGLIAAVKGEMGEGSESEAVGELSGYDQHPADSATDTFEREKDFSILESLEAELAEDLAEVKAEEEEEPAPAEPAEDEGFVISDVDDTDEPTRCSWRLGSWHRHLRQVVVWY